MSSNIGLLSKHLVKKAVTSLDSTVGKVALAGARTLDETGTELKIALGGLGLNLATKMFDLDAPFAGVGLESLVGTDSFIDNASDIAIGLSAVSAGYKFANNLQKVFDEKLDNEAILKEFGIEVEA